MPVRLRLALMVAGSLALVAIVAIVATGAGTEAAGDTTSPFRGAVRPEGIAPAEFGLDDQAGRPVRLADLRGRPAVVTFQYTHCKDTCPLTTQQIRGALDELGHDVPVIAVSVDPASDTPASARAFLAEQHMSGRMRWALGGAARLQPLWREYGIQPQSAEAEHSASTVLLDARGRQRVGYPSQMLTPEMLAHDIAALERDPDAAPR